MKVNLIQILFFIIILGLIFSLNMKNSRLERLLDRKDAQILSLIDRVNFLNEQSRSINNSLLDCEKKGYK